MSYGDMKPCTVGELIAFLSKLPPEREVLFEEYSDYAALQLSDIQVEGAVRQPSYFMRSHPTMSADNKEREKIYVIFPGN